MRTHLVVVLLTATLLSCGGKTDDDGKPNPGMHIRIGQVMVEVGHRFETSGRAAEAERWELAQYEAHEIIEIFDADMSRALLPGGCDDRVSDSMFALLRDEQLPALRAAAGEEDREAYNTAFDVASRSCNGCHTGCQVHFVQVPAEPGREVPRMDGPDVAELEPELDSEQ